MKSAGTIGTTELSAWQVAPSLTWVQTRSPRFSRKLSQRSDSRLVATGVAGGFLRTFEFRHGLSWAKRLITRYTAATMATNARFSRLAAPLADFDPQTGSACPPARKGQKEGKKHTHPVVPCEKRAAEGKLTTSKQ